MKFFKAGAAGLICALAVAACGSSGSGSGSGGSGSAPSGAAAKTSKLTGTPIPIMGTGTFAGTSNPFPQMKVGISSAVDTINANGGINGHPLKLTTCNDQDNPNVAQSCAQQAVSNHDVAVVTGNDSNSKSVIPTLQQAGIPFVGNITNSLLDATSSISFPAAPGGFNGNGADAVAAKAAGCKKAVTVTVIVPGATKTIEDTTLAGLKRAGVPNLKTINVSLSATNFAPVVAAAKAEHADCLVAVVSEPETTAIMSQVHQTGAGIKLLVAGVNTAPLDTLHGVGNGVYMFSFSSVPGESNPPAGLKKVVSDIKKYGGSNTSISPTSFGGFASVLLVADALRQIHGTYTAKSVLAAMGNLTKASTDGVYPPYTTTTKPTVKNETREFNPDAITFKIEGTKAVPVGSFEPIPGL